jgi:hypothetical protein
VEVGEKKNQATQVADISSRDTWQPYRSNVQYDNSMEQYKLQWLDLQLTGMGIGKEEEKSNTTVHATHTPPPPTHPEVPG